MTSVKICIPVAVLAASACQAQLDTTRTVDPYTSFGEVIYRESCQRVAYTGQLAQQQAGAIDRVDVSGSLGRAVCVAGESPPVDAPPKLFAIVAERPELIQTVDAILPQPFLATLETFLERILPLYDDDTVPRAVAALADLLGKMQDDPGVSPALARLGVRHGYRPPELAPGLVHAIVEYPDADGFLGSFLGLIGPGGAAEAEWHTLLAAGAVTLGTAQLEPDPAAPDRTLKLALDLMLAPHPDLVAGTPRPAVARDARGLARVATDDGGAVVAPFVDADHDGLADIDASGRFVGDDGKPLVVAPPFPEPGVADTAPRDAQGRALTGPGATTTLYQYLDLDGTFLAGALREAPTLLDASKDTALGLAWGAQALLGPRAMQTRSYGGAGSAASILTYNGFDTAQSAVLDLLHAFVQLLGAPNADQILQSAATLLAQYESPASRVVGAMLDASDRGKQHPEAQVPATSTLYDELVPLVVRTLRVPGLAEDLVAALENPHVKGLAPMMARLMTAANQIDFNHTNAPFGSARGAPDYDLVANLNSITPVDRTKPDTDYNRSLMQRIAHMVHDSNGARFCNKEGAVALGRTFANCRLFEIDDLSLFYALNLASDPVRMDATRRATTYSKASFREQITDPGLKSLISDDTIGDTVLQGMIGITGFTRFPSQKALARALFLRASDSGMSQFLKDTTDPTTCSDGDRFIDVHDKSIFAWELPLAGNPSGFPGDTFFDAVRPLIDAFARHDECLAFDSAGTCTQAQNAIKIFVDLLAMLHTHWGSPQSSYFGHPYQATDRTQPRFAFPDNVVSFEPLIAEVLRGDLVPAVIDLAPTLDTFTVDGTPAGPRALPVLTEAMRYVFDPQVTPAGLAYRSGATSTVQADGVTPVPRATPFYLLADAFAHKRAVLAALSATPDGAMQAAKWKAAISALIDQVLTVDHTGSLWQFRNRRFHAMTQLLVDFVRGRLQAHATAGDRDSWVHRDLTADLTDKLGGPVFAALADLVTRLEHDTAARTQLYGLLSYLVDEPGHDRVFQTALTTLADQAQLFLDDRDLVPVARVLGAAMAPATGLVDAQIALVKRSHDLDTDKALLTVLRNLFRPDAVGVHPASHLADLVAELNRSVPGHGGDLDAGDEASLLGELRAFFLDNQRGFMRFVGIVQHRNPPQTSR